MRKAYYSLKLGLRSETEAPALAFGSSIHKALELWYQLPTSERLLPKNLEEQAGLLAYGHGIDQPHSNGAFEAIRQFVNCRFSVLSHLPEGDKRSLSNGIRILIGYFKHYANDGYHVLRDAEGKPLVERSVEFTMYEDADIKLDYFGTIDVILKHEKTGVIVVADHKTTASLGSEFYNRCKPAFQYSGYVLAAREALGIDTNLFLINGIQVAKTKTEFARQITDRTEDDFIELRAAALNAASRWYFANRLSNHPNYDYRLAFTQSTPQPCSAYGSCQYRPICEVPENLKQNVIKMSYGK